MTSRRLVIFDDEQGRWGPMTDLRPAFDLRSGALTNRQRIERELGCTAAALITSPGLAPLLAEQNTAAVNPADADAIRRDAADANAPWLLVNGRWLATRHVDAVRQLESDHMLIDGLDNLVAICVTDPRKLGEVLAAIRRLSQSMPAHSPRSTDLLPELAIVRLDARDALITRPWDLLAQLPATLACDLAASTVPLTNRDTLRATLTGSHAVRIHPTAHVHPMVAIEAQAGPVVIEAGVKVAAMTVLEGPCYLGPHTVIGPHTRVRTNVAAGPYCVLGGEVSHSIIQGYSNKSHAGYLGHALVGEWVNLGADTTVSNLKNTYGHIRLTLESGAPPEDSGQIKHGPIIGDYTRTAIGSRILTGSVLATATMLALSGFAPKVTRRFSFLTDAGEQRYDLPRFLASAEAAMARRDQHVTPALLERLTALAGAIA